MRWILPFMLLLLLPAGSSYTGYSDAVVATLDNYSLLFTHENSASLTLTVQDDVVYRTGYFSFDEQNWTPFNFTQVAVGGWVTSGQAIATLTVPSGESTDNYIIIYSCSSDQNSGMQPSAWDCHGSRWQIIQFNTSIEPAQQPAESSLLPDVPLIHNQTFLVPENAEVGDTVGDLNLMWVGEDQEVTYELIDDDEDRFSIEKLTGRDTVTNHHLHYEIRISVNNPTFNYDQQREHHLTIRATEESSSRYNDATITVKLSDSDKTLFVDPSWTGCHDGTRACPYNSWENITGGYNDGFGVITPGYTYLQKRGTTTTDILNIYRTATSDQHIAIGAYGKGERPVFDGTSAMSWLTYGTGIRLGTSNEAANPQVVGYYDIYSLTFTKWWSGILTGRTGAHHNTFTDLLFTRNTGPGMYLYSDYRNGQSNIDILDNTITDTVSEHSGGYDNDYGFKSEAGGTVFRYTVARFNLDIGFAGASGGYDGGYFYCQAYDSRDGIKVHGDDVTIDHTLIQDNERWGINNGNYYQLNYGLSSTNFKIQHSLVKNNGVGIHISQDADHGTIQDTDFVGNGIAIGFYRDGSFEGAPNNYLITRSRFTGNDQALVIGNSQNPYPYDITIAYNLFLENSQTPIVVTEGKNISIYNNLFRGNGGGYDIDVDRNEPLAVRNNLLEDGIKTAEHTNHLVDHNLQASDMFFVDAAAGDFHPAAGSPAINAGVSVGLQNDFDYNSVDSQPDIGPYEQH